MTGIGACSIRQLSATDGPLVRSLRLAALREAPDQFGETHAAALTRADAAWHDLAEATHLAEVDGAPIGMVFAFPDPAELASGRLGGMWVAPTARGAGVGRALTEAVKAWANARGMFRVGLWAVPGSAGERLYRRAGFVPSGAQKPFPGDASRVVLELHCALSPSGL